MEAGAVEHRAPILRPRGRDVDADMLFQTLVLEAAWDKGRPVRQKQRHVALSFTGQEAFGGSMLEASGRQVRNVTTRQ